MNVVLNNNQRVYIQLMPKDKDNRYSRPAKAALYNKSLTLPEKGLLSIMIGMNPYEPITVSKLSTKCVEHDDTVRGYLNSLEVKGLVAKELVKKTGAIKEYHYSLNELNVAKLTDRTFTDRLKSKKKQAKSNTMTGLDTVSSVAVSSDSKTTPRLASESVVNSRFPDSPNKCINSNNNIINNNNNLDEIDNVENSIVSIHIAAEEKRDLDLIRNHCQNITDIDLPFKESHVINLSKQAKEFYKGGKPLNDILEMLDIFPKFAKANKTNNPKKSFSEMESLAFLASALKKNFDYPTWFTNSLKKSEIQKPADDFIETWKCVFNAFKVPLVADLRASRVNLVSNLYFQCDTLKGRNLKDILPRAFKFVSKDDLLNEVKHVLTSSEFKTEQKVNSNLQDMLKINLNDVLDTISNNIDSAVR